ncbi:MAG: orotate phosphoribosyltransferase, partial [Chloroflexi bacterium]|nr:orotate phosphoribosyltransferase [Chloroflexota bacterium]
ERVLLIEDVVTSGGAAMAALEALRGAGAEVNGILAVIDREDGGAQRLASAEVPFLALFTRTELGLGGS